MVTIKLIKETDLNGEITYKVIDENNDVISGIFGFKPDADRAFERAKENIERFGILKSIEVLKEFTHPPIEKT